MSESLQPRACAVDAGAMKGRCPLVDVRAAGAEADPTVVAHWREMWLEAGFEKDNLLPDLEARTLAFIEAARNSLDYQTFVAVSGSGGIVGSASCQVWSGPVPLVVKPSTFKLGTVWAVYVQPAHRRRGVAARLMESVKEHWRRVGCLRGVLLHATQAGRAVYEQVGFEAGNLLLVDLHTVPRPLPSALVDNDTYRIEASGAEADEVVVKHWRQMWLEAGVPARELRSSLPEITLSFIEQARASLQYQTFVARNSAGSIIGSASCQAWSGPLPLVLEESAFKLGTVWAVHVQPEYRRRGVATKLMEHCMEHWRSIGCQRGVLLHATDAGRRVYERLGFEPSNGMVIDLCQGEPAIDQSIEPSCSDTTASTPREADPMPLGHGASCAADDATAKVAESLREAGVVGSDDWLRTLAHALPQQLEAAFGEADSADRGLMGKVVAAQRAHGTFIDPCDNWFTQNVRRFGGGFDMKKLTSEPGLLASKFDRLSHNYDHWVVGNRSRVEQQLSRLARRYVADFGGLDTQIVDVACGIGLPGHQLRLCGFRGQLLGLDISSGMIEQAHRRGAHDALAVADANLGLPAVATDSIDLVLCTGALELLDHSVVLPTFARILKAGGHAWLSFQLEGADATGSANGPASRRHPTAHQNVYGATRAEITAKLTQAGFAVEESEQCDDAFHTPSPDQDGSLLPVPYLFVVARRLP